jgi:hypothetical protein
MKSKTRSVTWQEIGSVVDALTHPSPRRSYQGEGVDLHLTPSSYRQLEKEAARRGLTPEQRIRRLLRLSSSAKLRITLGKVQ